MISHLKLSQNQYSGRLRPHEHTSYVPLAFLVFLVGVVLTSFSFSTFADAGTLTGGSSIGLTGTMPAAPPTTAATITTPTNLQHFTSVPITVAGTCPANTIVEIYKNDIFAGSTPCAAQNSFSLSIDLLSGQNVLIARVYDALNQAGPDSAPVTVFYDALPPQTSPISLLNFNDNQLLLNTDAVFRGVFPGQQLTVPINIAGGTPPYAINIQWGDGSNQIVPRSTDVAFNVTHVYQKPGTYEIAIQGSDSDQRAAYLEVAAIVNGQPSVITTTTQAKTPVNELLVLWPLWAIIATMLVSFWLGEQREKRVLAAQAALAA